MIHFSRTNLSLDVHMRSRTGHSYSQESDRDIHAATLLIHIDDVIAVITGTLLQALPYLARLSGLLETWSTRLSVLRIVPCFLKELGNAQVAMQSGWDAIGLRGQRKTHTGKIQIGNTSTTNRDLSGNDAPGATELNRAEAGTQFAQSDLTIDGFKTIDKVLSDQIESAGQKLDRMLDTMEGQADSLPRDWIQHMERLEEEYSDWVCEARRVVFKNELRKAYIELKSVKQQVAAQVPVGSSQANASDIMKLERDVRTPDEEAPLLQSTAQTLLPNAISPGSMSGLVHHLDLEGSPKVTQALSKNGLEGIASDVTEELQMDNALTEPITETEFAISGPDTKKERFPPKSEGSHAANSPQNKLASDIHLHQSRKNTMLRPKSAPPHIPHTELSFYTHRFHQDEPTNKMIQDASQSISTPMDFSTNYPLKPVNDVDVRYNISKSNNRPSVSDKGDSYHESYVPQHLLALKLNAASEKTSLKNQGKPLPEIPLTQRDQDSKRPAAITIEKPVKEIVTAPSSASSYISDLSSPELQDAFAAVAGKPVIVTSRPASFPGTSNPIENQAVSDTAASQASGRKRIHENSTTQLFERPKSYQTQDVNYMYPDEAEHGRDSEEDDRDMLKPRRASLISMTSIEVVDKTSVCTVLHFLL